VAPPKDQSARAHILPRPELNPLVNPLLGDNMGRWAEVYFTSAPEKREEAVLELIRELEAGGSPEGGEKSQPPATLAHGPLPDPDFPTPGFAAADYKAGDQPGLAHCYACGHDNPATHQFCGMCGARQAERGAENPVFEARQYSSPGRGQAVAQRMERDQTPMLHYDQPLPASDELSQLRRISGRNPEGVADFHFSLEPSSSRPYRVYFGAALVVGLVVGVYMWGHGWQVSKGGQQVSLPAAATEPAPAPAPATAPATTATAVRPAATNPPAEPRAAHPVATAASNNTHTERRAEQAAEQPSATTTPDDTPPVSSGNGREELAMAERELSEATGAHHAEAAQWLWKSIAKHNSEATLLLADLYLKGDGVPKNCDQARVLLDTAARKGIAGAAERLRNLQAFGCP
jgi:hypothetical protein